MSKRLKIQTLFWSIVFFAASMSVMLVHAANKVIVVTDVAQDQLALAEETAEGGKPADNREIRQLQLVEKEKSTGLEIPLKPGVKAENVTIENHYMDREVWIYIEGGGEDFYEGERLTGKTSCIKAASYDNVNGSVLLKLALDGIYECRNILEENKLYIEFAAPREIYDKIIVIDPACGGGNSGIAGDTLLEKDITLDIARRLKARLDETDIKVYYTRMEDKNPAPSERIGLANQVKADMFICIALSGDRGDEKQYGTEAVYNENFFIPGFGSLELADLLEREVVTAVSGRGNGLTAAGEKDEVVDLAEIPAAIIQIGYLTNPQEAALLSREDYRERVAEGLFQAIEKAYDIQSER